MAAMDDIDAAWLSFCEGVDMNMNGDTLNETENNSLTSGTKSIERPKCSSLYISTKTKISYLSHKIELENVFWKVPVIPYHIPKKGSKSK